MAGYPGWSEHQARAIIDAHAKREGGMLPALHALQDAFGYVPAAAVPLLADAFNQSRADVHGTISFYHDFRHAPPGRHVVRFCRAESCQARGGDQVGADLRTRLGIDWGGTTEDGRVTLEPAFCLGLCAVSPAALLDGAPIGRASAESIVAALDGAG